MLLPHRHISRGVPGVLEDLEIQILALAPRALQEGMGQGGGQIHPQPHHTRGFHLHLARI